MRLIIVASETKLLGIDGCTQAVHGSNYSVRSHAIRGIGDTPRT